MKFVFKEVIAVEAIFSNFLLSFHQKYMMMRGSPIIFALLRAAY
jgi:hypothetical protein